MQLHAGNLDDDLVYAAQHIIPLVIFKSFQIYLNYPNTYKIADCLLFVFQIPVCYVADSPVDLEPLIIRSIKPKCHLKTT